VYGIPNELGKWQMKYSLGIYDASQMPRHDEGISRMREAKPPIWASNV
jgi:hypothetical protein